MTSRFVLLAAFVALALTSVSSSGSVWAQAAISAHQRAEPQAVRRTPRANMTVPFEAFGALAGAMTSIAAAEHQREAYGPSYWASSARTRQPPLLVTRPVSGTP